MLAMRRLQSVDQPICATNRQVFHRTKKFKNAYHMAVLHMRHHSVLRKNKAPPAKPRLAWLWALVNRVIPNPAHSLQGQVFLRLALNILFAFEFRLFYTARCLQPLLRSATMNLSAVLSNTKTNLSAGTGSSSQSSVPTTATTAKVAGAASPLTKASERIQKQVDSTKAQLSKLGLVKSSVAGLQAQSKLLTKVTPDMSASAVTTLMGKFFNAYNDAVASIATASSAADGTPGTAGTRAAAADLRRVLSADPEVSAAMRNLGLKINPNGTLAHDAKVFANALSKDAAAVQGAIKAIGAKAGAAADRELASSGPLESTVSSLNQRGSLLAAQQKAIKAYGS